jgi:BMFP domain-containing protein YqiC
MESCDTTVKSSKKKTSKGKNKGMQNAETSTQISLSELEYKKMKTDVELFRAMYDEQNVVILDLQKKIKGLLERINELESKSPAEGDSKEDTMPRKEPEKTEQDKVIKKLELENNNLRGKIVSLEKQLKKLESTVAMVKVSGKPYGF